jgi:RIO-like serine/threonine protein kinase
MASHSLNSDFFWYELGDVIGIGNRSELYYCFPKDKDVVTKARLAAEEIYKKKRRRTPRKKEN